MRDFLTGSAALSLACSTLITLATTSLTGLATASSHREAPAIAGLPRVDGSDFYLFRSYQSGRTDTVTMIANYQPFQVPFSGAIYYPMDEEALYEIHVDNTGDGRENLTFQFRFGSTERLDENDVLQTYGITMVNGDRRTGSKAVVRTTAGNDAMEKPADFIGTSTFSTTSYTNYSNARIYTVGLPLCGSQGRVFVGQRAESTAASLGNYFDNGNLALGAQPFASVIGADSVTDPMAAFNVTSIAIEVPISCLQSDPENPVIGAWTTASLPQAKVLNPGFPAEAGSAPFVSGGGWVQVSRVGNPYLNALFVDAGRRDAFNASKPVDDNRFLNAALYPNPARVIAQRYNLLEAATPRQDLAQLFFYGIPALTGTSSAPADMLRLDTSIAAAPLASQNPMGVLACDLAGYPNGRRPMDDVLDIVLSASLGATSADNPLSLQFCDLSDETPDLVAGDHVTDGARRTTTGMLANFPYLPLPTAGSAR
ncbi:DUF4331 domain-containing protein [Alcanivorax sp. JB21]|uniref:DUF4331 domain-containing protein n=1 Tax=Alcanivorax limicola TaxID=2874102 RepID=UPI001CBCE3DC|nr:DUF4331 domain-containing protein [Alcanivorax limicola]MBZ2187766.1 DUF4331 domain-containing protein [Alcanivorax limicola]